MKIVHVVDSMEVGGAEILVSQMCRLQREQGHDPRVYAVATLGPTGEQLRNDGFVVEPHMGRHRWNAMRRFFQIFKQSKPDVVHMHNPTPTFYAALAARMAGAPSIVSTRHGLVAPPRRRSVELRYALAAACCDWIVGVCDATANNLKGIHTIPARKIVRIYNGALPLKRAAKEICPAKSGFTLVYVGRLAPVKNHGLLLHAFRGALSTMPHLRLWMVGDGSERKSLESLATELGIAGQVIFWGQQLDVAPFFSAADGLVMSSKSEGLPMSLLQGFSLGLPAIVTDVGGMAEAVRLAGAGLTVSPTDPAEMTTAMQRMAADDSQREEFSKNARAAFQSRFDLRAMADAYMELYRHNRRV
jgi:L-malate glycosyltransferase